MNLYTCNACRYTFPADTLSDRCPDCGKATANVKVCIGGKNILRSVPAIRDFTEIEVAVVPLKLSNGTARIEQCHRWD